MGCLGIRLPESPDKTITIHPKGFLPGSTYWHENAESGETREIAGADMIRDGFTLTLPKRSGAIWFYRELEPPAVQ